MTNLIQPPPPAELCSTRQARTRQRLLSAAAAEFQESGFDRATMDGVIRRAGASKRTLYRHFIDKQALYEAVILSMASIVEDPLPDLRHDPRELEAKLVDAALWINAICQNPMRRSIIRNVIAEEPRFPHMARVTQEIGFLREGGTFGPLVLFFDHLIAQGEIWFDDGVDATAMFASLAYGGVRFLLLPTESLTASKHWAQLVVRLFLSGAKKSSVN
ncbi:TetR/AcrR family transcriptional regulator [Paraburkholderia sp. WC7.3g]|uniref:TetR/AcrR family transcriptional regulator n=1 Tax=Paraburkholderia sp. WC7.3g TaxID=2991070 RepID=UPI003D2529C2